MRSFGGLCALLLGALCCTQLAFAQTAYDPEASLNSRYLPRPSESATSVEEITAKPGRPLWWTVSKGKTRVHILGVPWVLPEDTFWLTRDLEAKLEKSPLVITPPAMVSRPINLQDVKLPDVGPIPPDLAGRLARAARSLRQPPERYLNAHPVIAGFLLVGDFRASTKVSEDAVMREVSRAIGRTRAKTGRRIHTRSAGMRPGPPPAKLFEGLTAAGARACLEAAIAEVEAGPAAVRAAADAWRLGEAASALEAPRSMDVCAFTSPATAQLRSSAIRDSSTRIAALINGNNRGTPFLQVMDGRDDRRLRGNLNGPPGPRPLPNSTDYVAVLYLRSLVAQDGILDQLAQQGFTIENPRTE